VLVEVRGDRLQPRRDRVEALGERREVASEEREQRVADRVDRRGATLPDAMPVEVEDRPPDVVELELPLEEGRR